MPFTLRVDYNPHSAERTSAFARYIPTDRRTIGFAPWTVPQWAEDEETFRQQEERLRPILDLPDEGDDFDWI